MPSGDGAGCSSIAAAPSKAEQSSRLAVTAAGVAAAGAGAASVATAPTGPDASAGQVAAAVSAAGDEQQHQLAQGSRQLAHSCVNTPSAVGSIAVIPGAVRAAAAAAVPVVVCKARKRPACAAAAAGAGADDSRSSMHSPLHELQQNQQWSMAVQESGGCGCGGMVPGDAKSPGKARCFCCLAFLSFFAHFSAWLSPGQSDCRGVAKVCRNPKQINSICVFLLYPQAVQRG